MNKNASIGFNITDKGIIITPGIYVYDEKNSRSIAIGNGIQNAFKSNNISYELKQAPSKYLFQYIAAEAGAFWSLPKDNDESTQKFIENVGFYIFLFRICDFAQKCSNGAVQPAAECEDFLEKNLAHFSNQIKPCFQTTKSLKFMLAVFNYFIGNFVEELLLKTKQSPWSLNELLYLEFIQFRAKKQFPNQLYPYSRITKPWDQKTLECIVEKEKTILQNEAEKKEYKEFRQLLEYRKLQKCMPILELQKNIDEKFYLEHKKLDAQFNLEYKRLDEEFKLKHKKLNENNELVCQILYNDPELTRENLDGKYVSAITNLEKKS